MTERSMLEDIKAYKEASNKAKEAYEVEGREAYEAAREQARKTYLEFYPLNDHPLPTLNSLGPGQDVVVLGAKEVRELTGPICVDGGSVYPGEKPTPEKKMSHIGHRGKIKSSYRPPGAMFSNIAEVVCECGESFEIIVAFLRPLVVDELEQ